MTSSPSNSVINIPVKMLEKDLKPEDIDKNMFYLKDDQLVSVSYQHQTL